MKPLRLEARLRNNVLWHHIYDKHRSIVEFCKKYELRQQNVGNLMNLKLSPYTYKGEYTALAEKLSGIFSVPLEVLFPEGIYELPNVKESFEIPMSQLTKRHVKELEYTPRDERGLKEELDKLLSGLRPKYQEVLVRRFGLNGGGKETLGKIAEDFRVGKERIRQMEHQALRKLKTRRNFESLKGYL